MQVHRTEKSRILSKSCQKRSSVTTASTCGSRTNTSPNAPMASFATMDVTEDSAPPAPSIVLTAVAVAADGDSTQDASKGYSKLPPVSSEEPMLTGAFKKVEIVQGREQIESDSSFDLTSQDLKVASSAGSNRRSQRSSSSPSLVLTPATEKIARESIHGIEKRARAMSSSSNYDGFKFNFDEVREVMIKLGLAQEAKDERCVRDLMKSFGKEFGNEEGNLEEFVAYIRNNLEKFKIHRIDRETLPGDNAFLQFCLDPTRGKVDPSGDKSTNRSRQIQDTKNGNVVLPIKYKPASEERSSTWNFSSFVSFLFRNPTPPSSVDHQ